MSQAEITREATSSVELDRNAKGEYAWKIKLYLDAGEPGAADRVLRDIASINEALRATYLRPKDDDDD